MWIAASFEMADYFDICILSSTLKKYITETTLNENALTTRGAAIFRPIFLIVW